MEAEAASGGFREGLGRSELLERPEIDRVKAANNGLSLRIGLPPEPVLLPTLSDQIQIKLGQK